MRNRWQAWKDQGGSHPAKNGRCSYKGAWVRDFHIYIYICIYIVSLFPFMHSPCLSFNVSKLKFIISNSITEACNNSILLLGPRGCGKTAVGFLASLFLFLYYFFCKICNYFFNICICVKVLDLVLRDLNAEYTDMILVVWFNFTFVMMMMMLISTSEFNWICSKYNKCWYLTLVFFW